MNQPGRPAHGATEDTAYGRSAAAIHDGRGAGRPWQAQPGPGAAAILEVVRGEADPPSIAVGAGPVRLGRASSNQVVLSDRGVSRSHAEIRYENGGYTVRDLGSSNGTMLDGVRVDAANLPREATIELGGAALRFSRPVPEVNEADRLVLMGRSDLLRALEMPTLAAAAKTMSVLWVPKGGVLLRQGTPMDGMFFVRQGALRVVEINDEGGERVVARVETGSHFGERALVAGVSAPQTLVADQDSCVLELTKSALDALLAKQPDDSQALAGQVRKKLQTAQHQVPAAERIRRDDLDDVVTSTDVELLGQDKRFLRAKERLEGLARDPGPLLVTGAQGSGKKMFARYFHQAGPHRNEPYVELSVADPGPGGPGGAIFGVEARPGETAMGQIGFLEMIGEGTLAITHAELLDPHLQMLLADYLKLGWFHRLHGQDSVRCWTRVVLVATGDEASALSRLVPELRALVEKRAVAVPALTQRLKDIPLLAEHFLEIHAAAVGRKAPPLSREATERLVSYAWPGNVRELENVMQRAVLVGTQENIIAGDVIFVAPPEKEIHKRNVLRDDRIRDFIRNPRVMATFIWLDIVFVVGVLLVTLYGGLKPAGHPLNEFATNPGMLVTWLVWFPLLPVSAFALGRIWCGVCPIAGIGDLVGKVKRFNLPAPAFLKRWDFWLVAASFILVDYVEELFGVADRPWATAMFLVVIIYLAVGMTVLFERKAFCKYLCPLAGVLGAYSAMSIFEVRGNKKVCQTQCGDHTCHRGTAEIDGCPLFAYPASINTNAECMMCFNCVKSCDNRGVQLNLRPPLQELWRNGAPMLSLSVFSVILVGLMVKHQFPKLTWWITTQTSLGWSQGVAHTILFVGFGLFALLPFLVSSMLSAAASREKIGANVAAYGVAFLPLAFAGHLAHVLFEFLGEGVYSLLGYLVKVWNSLVHAVPIASSTYVMTPFINPSVVTFILFLVVLAGVAGSMVALVMIARRGSSESVSARVMPHMLLLLAMWVGYVMIFTGATGEPPTAAPAATPTAAVGTVVPGPAATPASPAAPAPVTPAAPVGSAGS